MSKTIIKILSCVIAFPFGLEAQTAAVVREKFPIHIVYKVNTVASKISLSMEKQMGLALFFQKQDSLASLAMKTGGDINKVYGNANLQLLEVLSPMEWNEYQEANGQGNLLSAVIKHRSRLNLDDNQVDKLLKEIINLSRAGINNFTKTDINKKLLAIISEKQYREYMDLSHKSTIEKYAIADWQKIKKHGLAKGTDSANVVQQILAYKLRKLSEVNYAENTGDAKQVALAWLHADKHKPAIFIKMEACEESIGATPYYNEFKLRKELGLNAEQQEKLLENIVAIEKYKVLRKISHPNSSTIEGFKGDDIETILTPAQHKIYHRLNYKAMAMAYAEESWVKIKQFPWINMADSVKIKEDIFRYKQQEKAELSYHTAIGKSAQLNEVLNRMKAIRPMALLELEAYEGKLDFSPYMPAIKHGKELALSDKQQEKLIRTAAEFEHFKRLTKLADPASDPDHTFKGIKVAAILEKGQYSKYLLLANEPFARKYADEQMLRLKKHKLTVEADDVQLSEQIYKHRLKKLYSLQLVGERFSSEQYMALKNAMRQDCPPVLLKVDALENKLPASRLQSAVSSYATSLKLSKGQLDSLLDETVKLEQLRAAHEAKGTGERFEVNQTEHQVLFNTLTKMQYDLLLSFRNQQQATKNTEASWRKLKLAGLTDGKDSVALRREILIFEHQLLVANERLQLDNTQINAFIKRNAEQSKPELLKELEMINKRTAADRNAKNALAW